MMKHCIKLRPDDNVPWTDLFHIVPVLTYLPRDSADAVVTHNNGDRWTHGERLLCINIIIVDKGTAARKVLKYHVQVSFDVSVSPVVAYTGHVIQCTRRFRCCAIRPPHELYDRVLTMVTSVWHTVT